MPKCAVYICKNRSDDTKLNNTGISYHRFPEDQEMIAKWVFAAGRPSTWLPTKCSSVCSLHFTKESFKTDKKIRRLYESAVPTLHLRDPAAEDMEPRHASFPYCLFTMMAAIRDRRALWDKNAEAYRNKMMRREAWDEVCAELDDEFDGLEEEAKAKIITVVTSKWANIRDAFMRSVKQNPGGQRPYVYREHLEFLLECWEPSPLEPRVELEDGSATGDGPLKTEFRPRAWKRKMIRPIRPIQVHRLADKRAKPSDAEADEDLAFFHSLLTPVRNLSTTEKVEFRIGVLTMLQHLGKREEGDGDGDYAGKAEELAEF